MTTPHQILKQTWGYDQFRPLQEDIIQSVLDGHDTLALLPTGGGKSICFQVPALVMEGICIVVSPLIALMKDQVFHLQERGISAVTLHAGMHFKDIDRILDNCIYGKVKFLYLSPERLKSDLARERISQMNVNLIAVDEAHCISQWGYDFRPPYLEIAEIRDLLPNVPIMALTATATPEVVLDIQEKLEFKRGSQVFQKSFQRSNLSYSILPEENKPAKLVDILKRVPGSGVVYVRSRAKTRDIAMLLRKNRISADYYHAGLSSENRSLKQEAWLAGKTRIMVSTNAFGMGIDKADVRTVVHMDLPDSMEAYFQEAGRAGRDGKKAYAVLLFENHDRLKLLHQFELSYPEMKEIRRTYQALGSYCQLAVGGGLGRSFDFDMIAFAKNFQLEVFKTYSSLKILEQAGWIALTDAIFIPSKFMIKVNKDELYDYQIRNRKSEKILQLLLRAHEGAHINFVQMRETQLAKFLKISVFDLTAALQRFHQDKIIEYRPAKDKPQLIYTHERVDASDLMIDMALYNFRKKQHEKRIEAAIRYVQTPVCRSQQLLAYFGEKESEICGICDVCTGRTKAELSKADFDKYRSKLELILKREKLSERDVIDSFAPKYHTQVLIALSHLLDEGVLELTDGKLVWQS